MKFPLRHLSDRVRSWLTNLQLNRHKSFLQSNSDLILRLNSLFDSDVFTCYSDEQFLKIARLVDRLVFNRVSTPDLSLIFLGLIFYRKNGSLPFESQQALIRNYELTNGLFQQLFHSALFAIPSKQTISSLPESLVSLSQAQLQQCVIDLKSEGYSILPTLIPSDVVDRMHDQAFNIPFTPEGSNNAQYINISRPPNCNRASTQLFNLDPQSSFYHLSDDPLLKSLASEYLSSRCHLVRSSLAVSFPQDSPTSGSAQYFHYDIDSFRWLKVFVYLTDVSDLTGPHEYIRGSHIPGSKPPELLLRNYSRLSDDEIDIHYAPHDRVRVTGPKGTVVLADTRCFHKGNNLHSGYRLMYQALYAPSDFGYKLGFSS